MRTTEHGIDSSSDVANFYHMRLMALLQELVRKKGYKGAAQVLEIDPKTVTSSMKSGQLTRRVREALERALQEGVGTAAERQRRRNEKLEAELKDLKEELRGGLSGLSKLEGRLDKLEGQVRELKETLPSDLKRVKMSLDGVRKYYGVQRRLIDQRLLALEASREGTETGGYPDDESLAPESSSVATCAAHPRQLTDATPTDSPDDEERLNSPLERALSHAAHGTDIAGAPAEPDFTRRTQRSKRKRARQRKSEHESGGAE